METEEVLHKLEELGLVELSRITGDYYQIRCPFHEDKKPSCGVLLHDVVRSGKTYPAGFTHCFRGDTEVITHDGIMPIAELCDNPNVQIINGNGEWETTTFRYYGVAHLWKIVLNKSSEEKIIFTTQNHEWFVVDHAGLYSTDLLANQFNANLKEIDKILEKELNEQYKAVAISEKDWEIIKKSYNNKEKKYEYIEENNNEKIIDEIENKNDIEEVFDDIIEYK